jgi:hypothetical protein
MPLAVITSPHINIAIRQEIFDDAPAAQFPVVIHYRKQSKDSDIMFLHFATFFSKDLKNFDQGTH